MADADIDWLTYVENALDFAEENHAQTDDIDWMTVRAETLRLLKEGPRKAPAMKALQIFMGSVPGVIYVSGDMVQAPTRIDVRFTSDPPAGRRLDGNIGYLRLTGTHEDLDNYDTYIEDVRRLIRFIDEQPVCGWVLDVRNTQPGTGTSATLTAVSPILGDGEVYTVNYDEQTEVVELVDGVAIEFGETQETDVSPYDLQITDPPIAVLTGVQTIGAGLLIVVATAGGDRTRTFGAPSGNVGFANYDSLDMPDGGVLWVEAESVYSRHGRPISTEIIEPDERILEVPTELGDRVLEAAENWLASIEPCASMPEQAGRTA